MLCCSTILVKRKGQCFATILMPPFDTRHGSSTTKRSESSRSPVVLKSSHISFLQWKGGHYMSLPSLIQELFKSWFQLRSHNTIAESQATENQAHQSLLPGAFAKKWLDEPNNKLPEFQNKGQSTQPIILKNHINQPKN